MADPVEKAVELLKVLLSKGVRPTENPEWMNIKLSVRLRAIKIVEQNTKT